MPQFHCPRRAWLACASSAATARVSAALLCVSALAGPVAHAQAPATAPQYAHVHGVARLGIAVQDRLVTLQLESPLDSLIGFEHRPSTRDQQAAVRELKARMNSAQDLFGFDAAAGCTLAKAEAESALFEPAMAASAGEAHADLDATFEYRCAHPERLTQLDVGLFSIYPKLQRLDVEIATGKGQSKRDLRRPTRTVVLTR